MSSAVSVVAAPQLLPAGIGLGTAAATIGVAALAGYASYVAIKQLHQDYQRSLSLFHERCEEDLKKSLLLSQQERQSTAEALGLADHTRAVATEAATVTFIQKGLTRLMAQLPKLPQPNPDLLSKCSLLLKAIEDSPCEVSSHLENYQKLTEQIFKKLKTSGRASKGVLAEEFVNIRQELSSPLLDEKEAGKFLAQLESLEVMARRQPALASQGLEVLSLSLRRKLLAIADMQQTRIAEAQEMRTLVGTMLAKLQALSAMDNYPRFSRQAASILAKLGEVLTGSSSNDLPELRRLSAAADLLFADCEKILEEETMSVYMQDQITDVMLSMGYKVAKIPSENPTEHNMVASVGQGLGVQFHINGKGQMDSEMIALSAQAAHSGHASQEHVCEIIDQVIEALKGRKCQVRERFRSRLSPHEELRIIRWPAEETHAADLLQAPKYMSTEMESIK